MPTTAEDAGAAALALRMQRSAAATLSKFDTGYWTYYSLPHEPSPLDYQQYVVQLLKRLGPTDARFADAATRFDAYAHQPPAFKLANAGLGTLRFWLSKPATVTVDDGGRPVQARVARRRLAQPRRGRSRPAPGSTRSTSARSTGRATARRSTRCRSCARPPRAAKPKAARRLGAAAATPSVAVGAGLDDPSQARPRRSSACVSCASASRGPPARRRPTRGSSRRCSACRPASGSSSS